MVCLTYPEVGGCAPNCRAVNGLVVREIGLNQQVGGRIVVRKRTKRDGHREQRGGVEVEIHRAELLIARRDARGPIRIVDVRLELLHRSTVPSLLADVREDNVLARARV